MACAADLSAELRFLAGSKLETLRIISFEANEAFMHFDTSSLPPRPATSTYALGESRFFDLSTHFPTLSTLKIDTKDRTKPDLDESDISGLPSTLTRLSTPNVYATSPTRRVCATLPRSLEIWDAKISFLNSTDAFEAAAVDLPHFWDDAPPYLRTLSEVYIERHSSIRTLKYIPRTLVDCRIYSEPTELSLGLQQGLPPGISRLARSSLEFNELDPRDDYLGSNLPKQIKSIAFTGASSFCRVMPTFPNTLTSIWYINTRMKETITESELEMAIQSHPSFWPEHLTSLASLRVIASNSVLRLLPPTLTALTIHWSEQTLSSHLLPPKLVKLVLTAEESKVFSIEAGMPASMKIIEVRGAPLSHSSLLNFPPSITMANFGARGIHNQGDTPIGIHLQGVALPIEFPSTLLELKLGEWSPSNVSSLPPGLTSLHITSLIIRDTPHEWPAERVESTLKLLPLTITSFTVTTVRNETVALSGHHFARLTALKELKLYYMDLEPIILRGLPLSIRTIEINSIHSLPLEFSSYINPLWVEVRLIISKRSDYINLASNWPPAANPLYLDSEYRHLTELPISRANAIAHCYPHPSTLTRS